MRAHTDQPEQEEHEYTTYEISPDVRDFISRMRLAWIDLEWDLGDLDTLLNKTGVCVPKRTLQRWTQRRRGVEVSLIPM